MARTIVEPKPSGLANVALLSGAAVVLWIWLAILGFTASELSAWTIFPLSLLAAGICGWVCWWALWRRSIGEPALIMDEVGIYDNISIAQSGRVKWREMEAIWIAGPKWMPFLCVLPDDVPPYLRRQSDLLRAVMWFNNSFLGAPVIIPLVVVDMGSDEIWTRISEISGAGQASVGSSKLPAGA